MLALKNIFRNKIRSFLTMLGVGLGVALFVTVTSYSRNLKSQLQETVTKHFDLIVQAKGASSPLASRLTPQELEQLQRVAGIEALPSIVIGAIKTRREPYFLIAGISALEPLLNSLVVIEGRVLQPDRMEMLLGRRAMRRLGAGIGDTVELSEGVSFTVVGSYTTGSRLLDKGAVLPMALARQLLKRGNNVNLALALIAPGYRADEVTRAIRAAVPTVEPLKSKDLLGEIRLFQVIDKFAWGLSTIAMIIAGVFVINTLTMSVYERTREIGILMAVGWSRWMITKTIFMEAMILCLAGGMVGSGLGFGFIVMFSMSNITGMDWTAASVAPLTLIQAMVMAIVMGMISAVYPVIVASRLSPAQAIRIE